MTEEQKRLVQVMARRVLSESAPSPSRKNWAADALACIEQGDMRAAARCGYVETTEQHKAMK